MKGNSRSYSKKIIAVTIRKTIQISYHYAIICEHKVLTPLLQRANHTQTLFKFKPKKILQFSFNIFTFMIICPVLNNKHKNNGDFSVYKMVIMLIR